MTGKQQIHESMERLYRLVEQEKSQLAKTLNVAPQTVSNWEDRGISKKGLELITNAFPGINANYILTGSGVSLYKSPSYAANQQARHARAAAVRHNLSLENNSIRNNDFKTRFIPVKSFSKMGDDGFFTNMGYEGDSGDGYVPSFTASASAYAVRGDGMSMYPAVRHGWYLVCDPEADPVPTEFVEVELKDGRRTIKEFIGVVNNVLHLSGVNGDVRMSFDLSQVESINAITDIIPPSRHLQSLPDLEIKDFEYE